MSGQTLQAMILERKGRRSYDRLSKDCDGMPKANQLQKMATAGMNEFPSAATIRGLSRGLNVSVSQVVMAAARTVGLPVSDGGEPDELVLQGAGALPPEAQELLVSMARQLLAAHAGPWGAEITEDDVDLAAHQGAHGIDPEDDQP